MSTTKSKLAIKQLLSHVEPSTYEQINVIIDNNGTLVDVENYCKLLEHAVKTVRTQLEQDALIANIGESVDRTNFAAENEDYNACVRSLLICLQLIPNPLYRDDLRIRYYNDLLNPREEVDYLVMRVSLENMVIKLNGGKPLESNPPTTKEVKSKWKQWLPSFIFS